MTRQHTQQQGFTLLEVMIALTIFAIISSLAWQILDGAMKTSAATDARSAQLNQVQRAYNLLERDLFQLQARAPRGETAMFAQQEDGIALTTLNGVSGQLQLERVGWRVHEHRLWRDVWSDIDGPDNARPEEVPILGQVKEASWRFYRQGWLKHWDKADSLPDGVELTLTMDDGETWRWVLTTPGDIPEQATAPTAEAGTKDAAEAGANAAPDAAPQSASATQEATK